VLDTQATKQLYLSDFLELVAQLHPTLNGELDPSTIKAGSAKRLWWCCSAADDHVWPAVVQTRTAGAGCPCCAGQRVCSTTSLTTLRPDLAAQWHPTLNGELTAETVLAGSKSNAWWQCTHDPSHPAWEASVANRKRRDDDLCPSCTTTGFKPALDGWLYLVACEGRGLLQIGISNDLDRRLKEHARSGWRLLESSGPMPGTQAMKLESALLRFLRASGAVMGPEAGWRDFSGFTESWTRESLELSSLDELFELAKVWPLGSKAA